MTEKWTEKSEIERKSLLFLRVGIEALLV